MNFINILESLFQFNNIIPGNELLKIFQTTLKIKKINLQFANRACVDMVYRTGKNNMFHEVKNLVNDRRFQTNLFFLQNNLCPGNTYIYTICQ